MEKNKIQETSRQLIAEVEKIIIGKREQLEYMVMAILAEGHVLLDDLPGSGKTTLVKALSIALGCDFKRIQFTPDLLPSDIIGMNIFNQQTREFQLMRGPVETNILLADEINRAIPRTQAALLEAMEEKQITIDGATHELPKPFMVMATQNPVERESTFQLPAAQMDRFFVKLSLGYPSQEEEVAILSNLGDGIPFHRIEKITDPERLSALQKEIEHVYVSEEIKIYIVELIQKTREHKLLKSGASPRASRSLFRGGKAYAAMMGRDFVTADDISHIAAPVLAHRIQLSNEARFTGKKPEEIIKDILAETEAPPKKEDLFNGN